LPAIQKLEKLAAHWGFSMLRLRSARLGFFVALVLLSTSALFGQVTGATLSGRITDSSGSVIAGARVGIENLSTGIKRETVTNTEGFYTAPNLSPGTYEVTMSAAGFATQDRHGVVLNVGGDQVIDAQMRVGQINENVQVTAEAPVLQLQSSDTNAVVDSRTVRELPLNGRSWTDLATLQPGVARIDSQSPAGAGADRGEHGFGTQLSISGGKPVQNNYRLDGISVNDYANGGPGNVLGSALGVDAIQEFSVITANYAAEYGRTSGGVVNAITRSGSNSVHANVYEFIRNSALDARNYFNTAATGPKALFRRNQFGGSIGAPIVKDKSFFFADYEGVRQSKGIATQASVPTALARTGQLVGGTVIVDPAAAAYLPLWHLPTPGLPASGDLGTYSFTAQQIVNENFFTTRIDHFISAKDNLAGTYVFDNAPFTVPDGLNITLQGHRVRRQTFTLAETHVFSPTFLNTVRVGFNRVSTFNNKGVQAINPLGADKSLGSVPGQNATRVQIGGGVASLPGGVGAVDYFTHGYNSYQAYDDAFVTRGLHTLQFGVAAEYIRSNSTGFSDVAGNWSFNDLASFLQNIPSHFDAALTKSTPRNIRQTIFGTYLQDTWKIRPNLTLDAGLRYEMATVPAEAHGKFVSLRNITDAQPRIGSQVFSNPTLRNFEPRLGFAWALGSNAKTVVHGGIGLFDVLPLPYVVQLLQVRPAPFNQIAGLNSGLNGLFYAGGFPALSTPNLSSTFIQQNPKRNYVATWHLNVQREITPNLAVIAGYVGSRGVHQQFKVDDADMTLPTFTPSGYVFPYSTTGTPPPTLNPNFSAIRSLWWNGHSSYDGLQIGATKRLSKGFQFQGSYTWSKSIDDNSTGAGADAFANSFSSLHWYDLRLNKSLSDFNTPRLLVVSVTWDLPTPKLSSAIGKKLLGGWEVGSIFSAHDGEPFSEILAGDVVGQNSSDPFSFPSRLGGPGCSKLVNPGNVSNYVKTQCFSMPTAPTQLFYDTYCNPATPFPTCTNLLGNARRNILSSPGYHNFDFSLYKNTRISERVNTQFRAEFFNILNHPNFQGPFDTNSLDPTTPFSSQQQPLLHTIGDARDIQFALKVIF
jgi:hypothetical protein